MANTYHGLPLEVSANVVECNWVDPHHQTFYVYMQYGAFKSLIQLTSPVSGISPPGFPPHFVFPLINGLSEEVSVGVSTDPNFSLTAIIGSEISLRNVVSHGGCTESSYLRKGSDNNSFAGAIKLKLQCANMNDGASSSSSRNIASPHVYPIQPQGYYYPPPATNPSYGHAPPPYVNPQPYSYVPPPPHHYHSHEPNNYSPPTIMTQPAAKPCFLQGLLTGSSIIQIIANLSQFLGLGFGF